MPHRKTLRASCRVAAIACVVGAVVAGAAFAHGVLVDPFVPAPDHARAIALEHAVRAGLGATGATALGCWLLMRPGIGRRGRIEVATAGALTAVGAFAVAMVHERTVNPGHSMADSLTFGAYAALGGALAGGLGARWLGRPGRAGWIGALLAAYAVTIAAGIIGGTAMWPGLGTVMGALLGAMLPIARPMTSAAWIGFFVILQVSMMACRRHLDRTGAD